MEVAPEQRGLMSKDDDYDDGEECKKVFSIDQALEQAGAGYRRHQVRLNGHESTS